MEIIVGILVAMLYGVIFKFGLDFVISLFRGSKGGDGEIADAALDILTRDVGKGDVGNVTNLEGDVSGIKGNLDDIPMSERADKPMLRDWVEQTKGEMI